MLNDADARPRADHQPRVKAAAGEAAARREGARIKLSYKEARELESLPAHIEALEAEQERLRHESESPEFYRESAEHIHAVLARLQTHSTELDAAMARWVELEERG